MAGQSDGYRRIPPRTKAQCGPALAFRAYVLRWHLPEQAWTDNGKDYISAQFEKLCRGLEVELHQTLPSKRTGESHGKSKPIERWFGTLERGLVRELPGWCGTHPKERPDDVLFPMRKAHEKFAARERADTPFLSVQQFEVKLVAWVEQDFLAQPSATTDKAPKDAFTADSHPVNSVSERALDVLLMRAKTRVVGRNGVSVDGRMYWNESFFGLRGLGCTVRWDPGNIGEVVVSVQEKGKADQVIIATSDAYGEWAEGDYEAKRQMEKQQRQRVRAHLDDLQRAAEGITPYHQVLEDVQARQGAELRPAAVNGTPVITPAHHLARKIDAARKPPVSNTSGDIARMALRMESMRSEPSVERPVFSSVWEKEQWEREYGGGE